ncbi:YfhO family protein [Tautonia plasticadhaerens]|uniref:Quinol:cytochrome C oxidoreductase n=1 Tax=Tautonia plasticadhaerens TaxID=2527974 RepID=A0A518H8F7_9BACT|nr:YfhO family protein [Tautonia plasticadhaerens]QDV37101.1 hypothetical protein ElP_50340 [Tautonia plasticadhaerens]
MSRFFGNTTGGNGQGDGEGISSRLDRLFRISGVVGLAGLGVCIVGAAFDVRQVLGSYLMAYLFWLGVPIGSTLLLLINHLASGTWGLVVRRPLEAGASTLALMIPLFLPIAIGIGQLYPWAGAVHGESHAEHVEGDDEGHAEAEGTTGSLGPRYTFALDEVVEGSDGGHASGYNHKEIWFNRAFFFGRAIGYFAVWSVFASFMVRWSTEQDRSEDPWPATRKMGKVAAPGIILVFLTATFALFDWAMSLDPAWYSTLYGAMLIIGMGLMTFAVINIVTTLLADRGALEDLPQPKRLRDLGNLMLAFVMLWAYTSYSQFLIIWSGDLSEEIPWYLDRSAHGWQYVVGFLAIFHFFLPFTVLLFRANKESTSRLRAISALILGAHVVDVFWLLAPSLGYDRPVPHLLDLAAMIGVGGLWLAAYLFVLKSRPLVVRHDPGLIELRAHAHPQPPQARA